MKKLSIITVCLNNKEGLEKTIKSVAGQSFSDFEFLIVDGGSTDGSYEVIQKNLDHINAWVSEKDKGIYNAMNKGTSMANGEYCFFLNSDDILASSNTLERIFNCNPGADIIYGNLAIMKNGRLKKALKYPRHLDAYSFYRTQSSIHQQAALIKRKVFDNDWFFKEEYNLIADWVFFLEAIILNKVSSQYYNIVFSVFTSEGISSNASDDLIKSTAQTKQSVLRKYFPSDELERHEKRRRSDETKIRIAYRRVVAKLFLYVCLIRREINIKESSNNV